MGKTLNLIKSDFYRYWGFKPTKFQILLKLLHGSPAGFKYSFWLRMSTKRGITGYYTCFMRKRLSKKYHLDIPRECQIGYGLYLGHGMCMVVNGKTIIGNNVNLSQFLNIGSNHETPAVIGDNVYIGPSVCIVEDVKIGDNSCIGAGAVVVKDVPAGATVAGVPAKVISYKQHDYIQNPWPVEL